MYHLVVALVRFPKFIYEFCKYIFSNLEYWKSYWYECLHIIPNTELWTCARVCVYQMHAVDIFLYMFSSVLILRKTNTLTNKYGGYISSDNILIMFSFSMAELLYTFASFYEIYKHWAKTVLLTVNKCSLFLFAPYSIYWMYEGLVLACWYLELSKGHMFCCQQKALVKWNQARC